MKYTPAPADVISGIQSKLTTITDLFLFCQTVEDHNIITNFRGKTFEGIVGIIDGCIDGCIDELEGLKK